MPESFHVDRLQLLRAGQVLAPDHSIAEWPKYALDGFHDEADLERFLIDRFPEGVTFFGKRNLLSRELQQGLDNEEAIEIVTELVRRASFPDRPSRFAVVFGSPTVADAQRFRATYPPEDRGQEVHIWRVSHQGSFTADMNLLKRGRSLLGAWLCATQYWNGQSSIAPIWEDLLTPPVRVLERV